VAAVAVTGCTSAAPARGSGSSAFSAVDCPADISTLVVAEATCGYLTVPEDRAAPGRTIRLFVTRVPAPVEAARAEPIVVVGTDLGDVPNLAGIAPLAQRTGREVIVLDPRGVGRSEPALTCPEVRGVAPRVLATAVDDPSTRAAFLDAVDACHQRLTAADVEVSAYGLTDMAADAEALRRALDIASWNVASFGTSSRIALELLRTAPDPIRAVMLDSPEWPGLDPRAVAAAWTREALAAVFSACEQDAACRQAHPDGEAALDRALLRVDRAPVVVSPGAVRFDAAALVQVLRQAVAGDSIGDPYRAEAVPATVTALLDGRTDVLATLATALIGDDPYCNGYHPRCAPDAESVNAVDFTVLCRDVAPFAGGGRARSAEGPGYAEAFGSSPYLELCEHWPVGTAKREVAEPVRSDVPVLVAVGAFDPYVRPEQAREGLRGLDRLTLVVDPAGGHNVVPRTDCVLGIRQAWLDDPTGTPATGCLDDLRPEWPPS
jgi:pimeloyl-ACP methyl ester carboxylesterase